MRIFICVRNVFSRKAEFIIDFTLSRCFYRYIFIEGIVLIIGSSYIVRNKTSAAGSRLINQCIVKELFVYDMSCRIDVCNILRETLNPFNPRSHAVIVIDEFFIVFCLLIIGTYIIIIALVLRFYF